MYLAHRVMSRYQWTSEGRSTLCSERILSRFVNFAVFSASLLLRLSFEFCLPREFWHFSQKLKTWSRSDENSGRVVESSALTVVRDGAQGVERTLGEIKFLAERGRDTSPHRDGEVKRRSSIFSMISESGNETGLRVLYTRMLLFYAPSRTLYLASKSHYY